VERNYDLHWSDVKLLVSCNGPEGTTEFFDESSVGRTITIFGSGVEVTTSEKKFGSGSLNLVGHSGQIYCTTATDVELGSIDWTVEGWFQWDTDSSAEHHLIGAWFGSLASWRIVQDGSTGELKFQGRDTDVNYDMMTGTWSPTLNTWHHIAADFDGTTYRLYADGDLVASSTTLRDLDTSLGTISIGADQGSGDVFDGWVDEVRLTTTVARYRGAFGVPTAAYPRPNAFIIVPEANLTITPTAPS
jgi:hypothetical protein